MCDRKVIERSNMTAMKKNTSTRNLLLLVDESPTANKKKNQLPKRPEIIAWPKKISTAHRRIEPIEKKKYFTERTQKISPLAAVALSSSSSPPPPPAPKGNGGYVKSQVKIITTSNHHRSSVEPTRLRLSSDPLPKEPRQKISLPPIPKPSKSTPAIPIQKTQPPVDPKVAQKSSPALLKSSAEYTQECSNRKTSLKKMGACAIKVECDDGSLAVYVSIYSHSCL